MSLRSACEFGGGSDGKDRDVEDEWTDGSSQRSSVGGDHFGECSYYCQNYVVRRVAAPL